MLKNVLFVLGLAAAVIAMSIGGGVGKLVGREVGNALTSSKPTQADVEAVIIEAFRETAETVNAGLPTMLDEEIRLDKATVGPGPRMVYHNTFVGYKSSEIDREWVSTSVKKHVQGNVCASSDMKPSLQQGAVYTYAYYGSDGGKIGDFDIRRTDCGFESKIP